MTGLLVVPLGVGDAFSAFRYSSCLALESAGKWLLIDCPHPIRKVLWEASQTANIELDIDSFQAVVLTHLHADHCSGLEGFAYFCKFALGRRARLLLHPAVKERLWEGCLAAGMERLLVADGTGSEPKGLDDYFEIDSLSEKLAAKVGPFTIECQRTIHHVPTTALKIHAGGRCLGYSSDTSFDPSLLEWLAGADFIIHETNYGVHTPYEKLAQLPQELRQKMRLIHYPDDFDLDASIIEPLREGCCYEV